MAVTAAQYEKMRCYRQQLLATDDGRKTLCSLLMSLGLFNTADQMLAAVKADPAHVRTIIQAVGILEMLGVWSYDTFLLLLRQWSDLPLPEIQENRVNGETT